MFDWNSLEFVSSVHTSLRWAIFVFLLLSVVAVALEIRVSGIKEELTERKQEEKLERIQAPRRLTSEEKSRIVQALSIYTDTKIKVQSWATDYEATQFATDFASAFRHAGWKVDIARIPGGSNWIPPGISVEVIYHKQEPESAKALLRALEEIGIKPEVELSRGKADLGIELIEFRVGQKL